MRVMSFWAQTLARFKISDVPRYFKTVRVYALWFVATCGTFKITAMALPDASVAAWVNNMLEYAIAFGGGIALLSNLPTPDHSLSEAVTPKQAEKIKEVIVEKDK